MCGYLRALLSLLVAAVIMAEDGLKQAFLDEGTRPLIY